MNAAVSRPARRLPGLLLAFAAALLAAACASRSTHATRVDCGGRLEPINARAPLDESSGRGATSREGRHAPALQGADR